MNPPSSTKLRQPLPVLRGMLIFLCLTSWALGQAVPAPQTVQWASVAVYRVQLHATTCNTGVRPPCYTAVLLNAVV